MYNFMYPRIPLCQVYGPIEKLHSPPRASASTFVCLFWYDTARIPSLLRHYCASAVHTRIYLPSSTLYTSRPASLARFLFSHYPGETGESSMDSLPLSRDSDGQLQMAGTGPVSLEIDYTDELGKDGHGAVFRGRITSLHDGSLVRMVSPAWFWNSRPTPWHVCF